MLQKIFNCWRAGNFILTAGTAAWMDFLSRNTETWKPGFKYLKSELFK